MASNCFSAAVPVWIIHTIQAIYKCSLYYRAYMLISQFVWNSCGEQMDYMVFYERNNKAERIYWEAYTDLEKVKKMPFRRQCITKFQHSPPPPHYNRKRMSVRMREFRVHNNITWEQKHLKCNHSKTVVAFSTSYLHFDLAFLGLNVSDCDQWTRFMVSHLSSIENTPRMTLFKQRHLCSYRTTQNCQASL